VIGTQPTDTEISGIPMPVQIIERSHIHAPRFDGIEILIIAIGAVLMTALVMM